jgi:hypothetical protein
VSPFQLKLPGLKSRKMTGRKVKVPRSRACEESFRRESLKIIKNPNRKVAISLERDSFGNAVAEDCTN